MKSCGDDRKRNMPGSYTSTSKYTSKEEYIDVYGYLNKSGLMKFQRFGNMKFAYRNRKF